MAEMAERSYAIGPSLDDKRWARVAASMRRKDAMRAARIALAPPIKTKPVFFLGAQAAAMAAEEENRRIEAANRENFMAAWELLPPWAKEVTEVFMDCEHIGWGSAVENLKDWIDRMS